MALDHHIRHPRFEDGCFRCKIGSVGFGSVPGGTRPGSARADKAKQFSKDMDAYWRARRAGERPEASTEKGVRQARQKAEIQEKAKKAAEERGWELHV